MQVQLDFDELPAGAAASLRDSLVGLLLRYAHGSRPTRTQLCLALAALAAHLPAAEWGGGGAVQWLAGRMAGEPSEAALPCMLELLTVLPQVRTFLRRFENNADNHAVGSIGHGSTEANVKHTCTWPTLMMRRRRAAIGQPCGRSADAQWSRSW